MSFYTTLLVQVALLVLSAQQVHGGQNPTPITPIDEGTEPEMGVPCTPLGRICAANASCINRECVCPPGTQGTGFFCCVPDDDLICEVLADPHLVGYGQAVAGIYWPCTYRLSDFNTILNPGPEARTDCLFEIWGINRITSRGRYVTKAVRVFVSVVDNTNQVAQIAEVFKLDIDGLGFHLDDDEVDWGRQRTESWHNVTFECLYDSQENFAYFEIPECGAKIKFRPVNNSETGAQSRPPGIAITIDGAKVNSVITAQSFPDSLCGQPAVDGDDDDLYSTYYAGLGLDRHQAVLFAALKQAPVVDQGTFPADYPDQCDESVRVFKEECGSDQERADGINACLPILKRRRTVRCLGADNVLNAFNICLDAFCGCSGFGNLQALFGGQSCSIPGKTVRRYNDKCAP